MPLAAMLAPGLHHHHLRALGAVVSPLSSSASALSAAAPTAGRGGPGRGRGSVPGPGPGRGPGPGPGRPGPTGSQPLLGRRRRPPSRPMEQEVVGNDTSPSLWAEPLAEQPGQAEGEAERDDVLGQLGVAEQLLIAWQRILVNAGPNATDVMGVDVGLLAHYARNATDALPPADLGANMSFGNVSGPGLGGLGVGGYMEIGNSTWTDHDELVHIIKMVTVAVFLGLVILATVIGNVFVIAAILLERHLQNVANYLILSLAVADLLVACLVMPLGAVYEVSQQWTLGPELCDMWTSSDVLCCTASILHLVAIALDRYWAVTNIDYIHQRTARRIGLMILVVWLVAFMVCIAPMLGWKDPGWDERVRLDQECMVSQDIAYQIFATASSFYLPLLVILCLYWRIYQAARRRIRRRVQASVPGVGGRSVPGVGGARNPAQGGVVAGAAGGSGGLAAAVVGMIGRPLPTISETTTTTTTTAFTNVSSNNTSPEKTSFANGLEADPPTADQLSCSPYSASQHYHYPKRKKEAMDSKRERKAAKTLAIITGAFVMCWLPFFTMAILQPVCDTCYFNKFLVSFFLWLGYFNSTLNPIIYTIFSPEFRHAFKRLLCGRRATLRRRNNRHLAARGRQL